VRKRTTLVRRRKKPDPGCSWEGHPWRVGADVGDESTESRGVVQPLRIPPVIRPVRCTYAVIVDELMICSAAGINGCVDLRRRAFPHGGQVSAEWSRCSGSMARRARDSVTPLRRSSEGWMPARIGRLSAGAGRRQPVTIRKTSLMLTGTMRQI